jgi:low affinity Fe/Cu permease
MKSSGFSFTYLFGWIATFASVVLAVVICTANAKSPAIVLAAEIFIVTSIAQLAIVPIILLSILRDTRRSADYLQELAERQGPEANPSTVIR